jgi:hypothetical protein
MGTRAEISENIVEAVACLGDAAIDLAPMEGSNTDDLESNHRVISNCAVIRI